eukprot:CAMPEP_0197012248 /NCGR_PEP_ID=MMETSP1380-20130617/61826_1 /TAXON_ID=5936 /ORGANISM="Euplotes crassus, Strain CT5" /LENGTH=606 /DNA_ID=CAMNT_0042435581 /DNA_START=28 /DNA_END=1848 /DNA_ORIENTATION=+
MTVYVPTSLEIEPETDMQQDNSDMDFDRSQITVRCCLCGTITPRTAENSNNICAECMRINSDITEGITKQIILYRCRTCLRYNGPPWIHYERESPQLLTMLLKKVKGLKSVKLLDANFVYTEEHSKRIKIRITIQKEVDGGSVLQTNLIVEYVENNQQCEECQKSFTPHIWTAVVQVRQKVDHKRTFLYLEQLILKNKTHDKCIKVSEKDDGLDFYFKNKSGASSLKNFITSKIPIKFKVAKKLISHDVHTSNYNYKYTILCDIAPICRDDLCVIPKKLSNLLGGIGPLVLCYKVSQHIHIVDVMTMETQQIDSTLYYQHVFQGFMSKNQLTEFIVIDIDSPEFDPNETKAIRRENFRCVQVELKRASDLDNPDKGSNDTYLVNTHLGEVLNYNDSVLCYDLANANLGESIENGKKDVPDVVPVKKYYPRFRRKNRKRYWKLDRIPMQDETGLEEEDMEEEAKTKTKSRKKSKKSKKKSKQETDRDREFEEFLQQLEEDPELRQNINLYPDRGIMSDLESKFSMMNLEEKKKEIADANKLIKKKKIVKAKRKTEKGKELHKEAQINKAKVKMYMKAIKEDDESDLEEDFPVVQMTELLDNLKLEDD